MHSLQHSHPLQSPPPSSTNSHLTNRTFSLTVVFTEAQISGGETLSAHLFHSISYQDTQGIVYQLFSSAGALCRPIHIFPHYTTLGLFYPWLPRILKKDEASSKPVPEQGSVLMETRTLLLGVKVSTLAARGTASVYTF